MLEIDELYKAYKQDIFVYLMSLTHNPPRRACDLHCGDVGTELVFVWRYICAALAVGRIYWIFAEICI